MTNINEDYNKWWTPGEIQSLFNDLVGRAVRARRLRDRGGDAYHLGWQGGVFDTCQRVAVRLGYSDVEFFDAVEKEMRAYETQ